MGLFRQELSIESLPAEILGKILENLSANTDLKNAMQVCKRWEDIAKNFWKIDSFLVHNNNCVIYSESEDGFIEESFQSIHISFYL